MTADLEETKKSLGGWVHGKVGAQHGSEDDISIFKKKRMGGRERERERERERIMTNKS